MIKREAEAAVNDLVDGFLTALRHSVRHKPKQCGLMLGVLWCCYLNPEPLTQLEAAGRLGVSDSLVSVYRARIERILRGLPITSLEAAGCFERSLCQRVGVLRGEE